MINIYKRPHPCHAHLIVNLVNGFPVALLSSLMLHNTEEERERVVQAHLMEIEGEGGRGRVYIRSTICRLLSFRVNIDCDNTSSIGNWFTNRSTVYQLLYTYMCVLERGRGREGREF